MKTKNILICGGSSGLGLEIAKNFLSRNNNKVIIVSRDKKKLLNLKKKIKFKNLDYYACDFINEKNTMNLMKVLKKKYKSIDLLISSVGVSNMKITGEENYSEWLRAYNSNFFSQTNITENYLKYFRSTKLKKNNIYFVNCCLF
jgi:short-subunit dehydrogenase